MRFQAVVFVAILVAAVVAVPLFYRHMFNNSVWLGGMIAFIGLPLLAGILQTEPNRTLTLAVLLLLSLCPLVGIATDPLGARSEELRDGHFLATGAAIIFVSATWTN